MGSKEIARLLLRAGFVKVRQSGSHATFRHPDGRKTTVAMGKGDVPIGTLSQIEKDSGLALRRK